MSARLIQHAQAVVAALNGKTYGLPFTAERKYLHPLGRVTMGDTNHVHVFPLDLQSEPSGRSGVTRDITIVVMLRRAVEPTDTETVDALILMLEAFMDDVYGMDSCTRVVPASPSGDFYDADQLSTRSVFVGGVAATFTS